MISLRRNLDDLDAFEEARRAYVEAATGLAKAAAEPFPHEADGEALGPALEKWVREFAEIRDLDAVREAGRAAAELLHEGWSRIAAGLHAREHALTEIISLLAETAAKLDGANRDFYRGLRESAREIEKVGRIENIEMLRENLAARLAGMRDVVDRQEKRADAHLSELRSGISEAKRRSETVSRLVRAPALGDLPSRRHARQRLAEFGERRVSLAMVALAGLGPVGRRYGPEAVEDLRGDFVARLRAAAPPETHLYQWSDQAVATVSERASPDDLQALLRELSGEIARQPLKSSVPHRGNMPIEPRYTVSSVDAKRAETWFDQALAALASPGEA